MPSSLQLIFERFCAYAAPAIMIWLVFARGMLPAIQKQRKESNLRKCLSPTAWWAAIFSAGFPALLEDSTEHMRPIMSKLFEHVSGKVLEVGAGSGLNIQFYNHEKVSRVFGVEPYDGLHAELQRSIKAARMSDSYTIVPHKIDSPSELESIGITPGSFDTVVLVRVMCSIPEPQRMLVTLQKCLRPGGKLILFEHVRSKHPTHKLVQTIWTKTIWSRLFEGCELTRPTGDWLAALGGWRAIQPVPIEEDGILFPHVAGIYTKA